MCQLKSCLVLKDRVFCPDYDSHQQMLEKLGIEDNYLYASKTFVRVELLPPDGIRSLMEPLDKWTLKVDQDIMPEWWDEKADRQRVEEVVEIWRKKHVFTEDEHIVRTEEVYAFGNAIVRAHDCAKIYAFGKATVVAYGNTIVKACESAKVTAFESATVKACGNAIVKAYNSATVTAGDSATVEACGTTTVYAYDNATVKAYDIATVEAYCGAKVEIYDNVMAEAYDSAKVSAYNSTRVTVWNRAAVKAYDNAIAIYPQQKKAVYPIGWTIEIHK